MNKDRYTRWLQKELESQGINAPESACAAIAEKLVDNIPEVWAGSLPKPKNPKGVINRPVTAHFFLGIALVEGSDPYDPDAKTFAYEITEGDTIGDFQTLGSVELGPAQVVPALLEIGNDGTWFGEPEE